MITNHFLLDLKIVNTYILLSIRILQGSLTTEVNFQRYSRSYILRSSISYLVRQRRKMKDISPTFIFLVNFLMLVDMFCVYLITKFLRDHSIKTSANFHDFWPLPPTIGIPAKCLWRGFLILMYCSQKLGEDFANFCGLLRIYELYIKETFWDPGLGRLLINKKSKHIIFHPVVCTNFFVGKK